MGASTASLASMMAVLPSTIYCKLHIATPGAAGTTNAAGNTTRASATLGAAVAGVRTTTTDFAWTGVQVNTNETYSHFSLWDSATVGTCVWVGALSSSVAVVSGNTFTIPAGATLTLA